MATIEVVQYVCDLCKGEAEPKTHTVAVDGRVRETETCQACYDQRIKPLRTLGRKAQS